MNIERLKYFLDLTKTENFTETAENFFTTQGNISKHIIALEQELKTSLFCREHRKITLTEAGKALLPHVQRLLEDYNALQNAILPYQDSQASLKIYSIPVMANYNVTGIIAKFHQSHPDILLDVKEVESISLLKELNEGNCDIACIRIFEMDSDKYEIVTVEHDQFAVVLPENHPLANKELIQLYDLKNETFYQLDKNTQLYNQFLDLCEKANFKPRVGYTGTRIDNILDFISNGMGISLMMQKSVKAMNHKGIIIVPLDITISSQLVFIRPKNPHHSLACNYFWKYLIQRYM